MCLLNGSYILRCIFEKTIHRKTTMASPTADDENTCLLLALPLELREEIWRLSLPRSFERQVFDDERDDPGYCGRSKTFKLPMWEPGSLDLLRVNQQIYYEAMPLFWKRNTFILFVRGRKTKIAVGYPIKDTYQAARYREKPFFEINPEYTKLIKRWCLTFDTGYSVDPKGQVTRDAEVWAKANQIMPARILNHPIQSQYLPYRFIALEVRCARGDESRLSYTHAAFTSLYSFIDALEYPPSFHHVDLAFCCSSSETPYQADRGSHIYRGTSLKAGQKLVKLLPGLMKSGVAPAPGSLADKAWDWLELDGGTNPIY
ncbi:hypothetical protein AOQ84DRAFT_440859 [Glonium stellatum]|uniref:Uncharacterized protein n=1 Tax=Glonium stellatum TaxID=574774 RepID=A0A8E2EXK8_9PEZI|nr:hypothetical protein AOQ84DRAFT_440859 [Glonium stellatum]